MHGLTPHRPLIREIRGKREPVSPVQGAVLAVRVCLAAAKSYLENRCVNLSEIDGGAGV